MISSASGDSWRQINEMKPVNICSLNVHSHLRCIYMYHNVNRDGYGSNFTKSYIILI